MNETTQLILNALTHINPQALPTTGVLARHKQHKLQLDRHNRQLLRVWYSNEDGVTLLGQLRIPQWRSDLISILLRLAYEDSTDTNDVLSELLRRLPQSSAAPDTERISGALDFGEAVSLTPLIVTDEASNMMILPDYRSALTDTDTGWTHTHFPELPAPICAQGRSVA